MARQTPARIASLAAAALSIYLGCAVSEPIDIDQFSKTHQVTGAAGADSTTGAAGTGVVGPGNAGTTGAGASGNAGVSGTGDKSGTGTGGNQSITTAGQAGETGTAGAGGSGGNNISGQAGTSGDGGLGGSVTGLAGRGGTTGFAGSTGAAGRGGTTGFAGTTGSAGRGGTTGTAGRGGTTGAGGSAVDAGTNPDGAATQTFTDIYNTILVPYCSGSSCHSPGSQGGVSFASQSAAYTAVKARVTPGNGAGSRFYTTVNSGSMPRGAAKLSATNLAKIKTWIDQGALNN